MLKSVNIGQHYCKNRTSTIVMAHGVPVLETFV